MEKIMFVIVLLLVAGFAQADSWLEVEWAFQFGWIPYGNIQFYNPNKMELLEPFDLVFKINAKIFSLVKIGGECTNLFSLANNTADTAFEDIITFSPTGMTYVFFIGVEPIKGISIIYEHSCSHPVLSNIPSFNSDDIFASAYDRIYFEIKNVVSF